jgi:hypothetical protein
MSARARSGGPHVRAAPAASPVAPCPNRIASTRSAGPSEHTAPVDATSIDRRLSSCSSRSSRVHQVRRWVRHAAEFSSTRPRASGLTGQARCSTAASGSRSSSWSSARATILLTSSPYGRVPRARCGRETVEDLRRGRRGPCGGRCAGWRRVPTPRRRLEGWRSPILRHRTQTRPAGSSFTFWRTGCPSRQSRRRSFTAPAGFALDGHRAARCDSRRGEK